MVRIAINGFGRIGRMMFRAALNRPGFDVVAINDLTDTRTLAHLLKHDSSQGSFSADVSWDDHNIYVNGKAIPIHAVRDPLQLPWHQYNVDVVAECTGLFTSRDKAAMHLQAGARKVVISAPSSDADKVIVFGVNEHEYNDEKIVSNASCTTNCLAPLVKVLDDNFGVVRGFMTTIHAYTQDQMLQDAPHKDLRRCRAAGVNIVPTTTGAARAVAQVLPHLKGKLDGNAVRVPVPVGSLTDFVCEVKKATSIGEVNALLESVSARELKGKIEYVDGPLVSSDIIGNAHSSIIDSQMTSVIDGCMIKVVAWYDNEWGYSNRMVDLIMLVASR